MKIPFYRKVSWLLLGLSFWICQAGLAQTVTGTVSDNTGETLIGVNVVAQSSGLGVSTDYEGNYSIEAAGSDTLVFTYVGYRPTKIAVNNRTTIDLEMESDVTLLNEIVVVGYGSMRKSDVTGAIFSVEEEALTDVKSGNVFEALQGRVPGMAISRDNGRAGSDVGLLIRGKRSLNASNGPLVMVDGVPYGDNIDIAPEDIKSVEVLKDASSTAIYGSRGANGVILITTKRGTAKRSAIHVNTYYGIAEAFQQVPVYGRDGYIQAKIDANKDFDDWDTEPNPQNVFLGDELAGFEDGTETNWQDLVSQTGIQQSIRLGFEGGSQNFGYNTSLTYFKEKGVMKSDNFERFVFQNNMDTKVNDWIKVGMSSVFSHRQRDGRGPRFTDAVYQSPIVEAYDSLGNYIFQPNFANPRKSPLAYLEDEEQDRTTRIFSTVYGQVQILPNLTFRTNLNGDVSLRRFGYMYPQKAENEGFTMSGIDQYNNYGWLWNNILTYNQEIGASFLNLTLGHEVQEDIYEFYGIDGQEQQFDQTLWYNLASNKNQITESSLRESALVSFFGRANYSFDNKYIFNVSGRFDGASQLSEGNKWDFFPAASAAWVLSNEDFLTDSELITDMKLRVGYGVTGNASIAPYSTAAALNANPLYYQFGEPGNETEAFGYRPIALASADLRWERTRQFNLGVDFGFFNNRLSGTLDLFRSNTDRLLLQDQLPPSTGFDNVFVNAGATESYGWELYLRSYNFNTENFDWSTEFTFFGSREKITELASGLTEDEGNLWFVGQPIDVYYDFNKTGIWQLGEEDDPLFGGLGTIKVEDFDGNDTINFDDRQVLGTSNPLWSASIINTFEFFNFDLTVNIYAKIGHMIDAGAYSFDPRMYDNMLAVDYWTPVNPTNEYPAYNSALAELPYEYTLRYRNGSFVKLRNVTLGYRLPESVLGNGPFSNIRFYASGRNVAILHSNLFDGLDPERNGSINWPLARLWLFGVDVTF
ncbi:MAG: TonB-dependent receptor [Bacteroidetes bacterium]|nr:TonB-dependent receptor [Bacteroidota bacterium]